MQIFVSVARVISSLFCKPEAEKEKLFCLHTTVLLKNDNSTRRAKNDRPTVFLFVFFPNSADW